MEEDKTVHIFLNYQIVMKTFINKSSPEGDMARYKRANYTIKDPFYFEAIRAISEVIDRNGIPYAIVGGTAYQIKMASIIGGNIGDGNLDLVLRNTGDIDLTTDSDLGTMVRVFNEMVISNPHLCINNTPGKTVEVKKGRNNVYMHYQTEASDLKGLTDHYLRIIETAERVRISLRNGTIDVSIPKFEYLLASKLTRLAPKDQVDVYNLLNIAYKKDCQPDLEEVRQILKSIGKLENFDYIEQIYYEVKG